MVIREETIVLGYIFLCLPFFDMLTGFLVVRGFIPEGSLGSPSQLGRFLALIILVYFNRRSAISTVIIMFFFALVIIEVAAGFRTNSTTGLLFGLVTVVRFFYLYLLFTALKKYLLTNAFVVGKYLRINLVLISASIVIASVTGLGNSTYGWGFGTKGFFASGNGLGVYIGVSALILLGLRYQKIYKHTGLITIGLAIVSLILLGTKTSLLFATLLLVVMLWTSRIRFLIIPMVIGTIWMLLPSIVSFVSLTFDVIFARFENAQSSQAFLLSSRDSYVRDAFIEFHNQEVGVLRWWFGGGAFLSFQNVNSTFYYDTLEMDPFDVLFMYGLFGLIAYLILITYGIALGRKNPYLLLGISLVSLHSIIAGHVIFNGMSSTSLIIIIAIGAYSRSLQIAGHKLA